MIRAGHGRPRRRRQSPRDGLDGLLGLRQDHPTEPHFDGAARQEARDHRKRVRGDVHRRRIAKKEYAHAGG